MNRTNWEHAAWALAMQFAVWLAGGTFELGAIIATTFFVAREHTQANLRYLAAYGHRLFTPSWPEIKCLHPDNWDLDSMLDWMLPALAVWLVAWVAP